MDTLRQRNDSSLVFSFCNWKIEHMKCVVADNGTNGTDVFSYWNFLKMLDFFICFCVIDLMPQWTCKVEILFEASLRTGILTMEKRHNLGMKKTLGIYHLSLISPFKDLFYSKNKSPASAKWNTFPIFPPRLNPIPFWAGYCFHGSKATKQQRTSLWIFTSNSIWAESWACLWNSGSLEMWLKSGRNKEIIF